MIRTVLFDLGNVIFLFSHARMCQQMGQVLGVSADEIRRFLFESGHLKRFETGQISETELHRLMEKTFSKRCDFDALRLAGSDIFELNRPIVPVIHQLQMQGYRLVLLSNTSVSHMEFLLERYQILQKFDDFVLSFEVGSAKPEPAIYRAAVQACLCEPEEIFYTDDIQENVDGALRAGMHAHLFTSASDLRPALSKAGVLLHSDTASLPHN